MIKKKFESIVRFEAISGRRGVLFVASMMFCTLALAQTSLDEQFDEENKPWEEIALQLPAPPQTADLLPFEVSAAATQIFAIDQKSLSVGSDGVIRFTLVTTSRAGARNVDYEGIRCSSFERKMYAVGRADGIWIRSRQDQWNRIKTNVMNRQQAALAQDYFCAGDTIAGSRDDMLRRLRRHDTLTKDLTR
jgi:hypothetical protein